MRKEADTIGGIEDKATDMQRLRKTKSKACARQRNPQHQGGSSLIEFAVVSSLLFTLLLGVADFGQLFWSNLTMQHAVREGTRYAVTGNTAMAATPAAADARCQAAIAKIREQAMGAYERLSSTVTFKTVANDGSTTTIAGGACYTAGQIIVIEVDSRAPVLTPFLRPFFPNGEYAFSVSTTMRNEAFQ